LSISESINEKMEKINFFELIFI